MLEILMNTFIRATGFYTKNTYLDIHILKNKNNTLL